jgi:nucleotide-binding universal stress UspA family protein
MAAFGTILLPTDFSAAAAQTARCAVAVSARFGSRLILLHALPPVDRSLAALEGGGVLLDEVLEYQKLKARQSLEEFAAREMPGWHPTLELVDGDPADLIGAYAQSHAVDLIMMPTRGCGPFRRFVLGSVTAKVLHDVECPVWTGVHVESMPALNPPSLETILCAIDLRQGSQKVLAWAGNLAAESGARLIVAHAIPSLAYNPETYYLEADLRRFLIGQAREKIGRLLAEADLAAEIVVEGGPVACSVRSVAEDSRASLVVIGRAGGNRVMGRLRTNSYAIIRDCPCPVVSV